MYDPFNTATKATPVEVEILPNTEAPLSTNYTAYTPTYSPIAYWLDRAKWGIALGLVGTPMLIANLPFLKAQMGQMAAQRQANNSAAIAESRYAGGCLPVVWSDAKGVAGALSPGKPVAARSDAKGRPLVYVPAGVTVCDVYGGTGVLQPGNPPTLGDYAFTGNQTLVQESLKAFYSTKQVNPLGVK